MQIGIDAGTKFLKIVYTDKNGIIPHVYCQHFGNPEKEVTSLLKDKEFSDIERIVFSGAHAGLLAQAHKNAETADEISAIIECVNYLNIKCRYIVNVGSGSIKLIELDDRGSFSSYLENSLCAAGTGSFLDEQMHRMNFSYKDIETMPFIKDVPDVATRCAVFAKSDLIHRQQEGYSREEMWSGLCKGVAATMLQSVFKGNTPSEETLFCGGLFLNPIVKIWVKDTVKNAVFNDNGHFFSAVGSVILNGKKKRNNNSIQVRIKDSNKKTELRPIELKYSNPVSFTAKKEYFFNDLEVRIHKEPGIKADISLGIDIGSTSTKLIAIEAKTQDVLIDIYGRTKGNPVEATRILFNELSDILGIWAGTDVRSRAYEKKPGDSRFNVVSAGTTGSGRKLIGKIIGADIITNEITAHYKGAAFFNPTIETIFEIGGQDSKYIRAKNGHVVDCNMNFVCAAGTGSFIEEQAQRLGFNVREIGDLVLGITPPHTSDRCTVFMEQDINKLLRNGYTREEVLAGIIRSICKNYLNRVVGSRPVTGDRIFFQGATARNKGLAAVFESILQKEIIVSPHCHVMGAFGAAILSLDRVQRRETFFRGLDIFEQKIELEYTRCDKCANLCKITTAKYDRGLSSSWGFMCGKESLEEKKPEYSTDHFRKASGLTIKPGRRPAEEPETKKIGIPFTLSMHNYLPLWRTFLDELGFEAVISGQSTHELKEKGIRLSKSDFCFPVKLSLAHFHDLADRRDIDAIFYPAILSEKKQDNSMPRMFCPYVIAYPSLAKESLAVSKKIISPSIDFRQNSDQIINTLYNSFKSYNLDKPRILNAYNKGIENYNEYLKKKHEYGNVILTDITQVNKIRDRKKTGIVCIGRPYNLYDKVINLGLTESLRKMNIVVFPYEFLIDPEGDNPAVDYMYWNYGEKILSVAERIRWIDNIYPVYFTNFSCGPDSFVLSRFEEIMAGKPYLIIELDEHGSETGYLTRIEAFMDVILEKDRKNTTERKSAKHFSKSWKQKERKIWFPPMFEIAPRFFAAAFRAWGFDAEALPTENEEAYEFGRQNTRGSECLPACSTIGVFLQKLKKLNSDPSKHALFMPTAEGPCRFGQYAMLHRSILDKNGFKETEIFSPTSMNSYMGMGGDLRRYLLDIIMSGDILTKLVHKTRPYEINKNDTDRLLEEILMQMESVIEKKGDLLKSTADALKRLSLIPVFPEKKPLVGIVGEIYVRSNPFCNNNVIRFIEESGGEVWLAPFSEWVIYTAWMERYFARINKNGFFSRLGINIKTNYMIKRMHDFENSLRQYIPDRIEPPMEEVLDKGKEYVPIEFEGETILTIGRVIKFFESGTDIIVNCAPFGCMPGNITTSIFHNIRKKYNKPIINLFYDGESDVNRIIKIYLSNIKNGDIAELPLLAGKQVSLTNIN
ncbi:MAG: acyl-CoA dehydratase activase [Spirochaetota bacterium]